MTENLATATKVATLEHSFSQSSPNLKTSGSKSHEAMWDGFDIHLNFNVQKVYHGTFITKQDWEEKMLEKLKGEITGNLQNLKPKRGEIFLGIV